MKKRLRRNPASGRIIDFRSHNLTSLTAGSTFSVSIKTALTAMKLLVIFLLATAIQLSAKDRVYAQQVTLSLKDAPLKRIFRDIRHQTSIGFLYTKQMLQGTHPVTIDVEDVPLKEALRICFLGQPVSYSISNGAIVISRKSRLEAALPLGDTIITVQGQVSNEKGKPLIGVSIRLKGANKGTVTDGKGHYSIKIQGLERILVFSYIGFDSREISVNGRENIDVVLQESLSSLDQLVVVGYGTQKKENLTGAISSVKSEDFENQQVGRLEQALQGRASGLTIASASGAPGSQPTVRIRGITSLNKGASQPLYVVDGIVVGNGVLDYLNPNDIKSIEVLKDAASAAIYGARSSAGVILITTKKGKRGKIRINYNGYLGIQSPAKKLDLLNAGQYVKMINEQSINDGEDVIFPNPESYEQGTDWQRAVFNNHALIQNHIISISGGSEKSTFYSSVGYFNQKGIVASKVSDYKRYTIRLNSSHKIKKWLTIGETLGYSHVKSLLGVDQNKERGFNGPLGAAVNLSPLTPIIVTNPDIINAPPYSTQPVMRNKDGEPYGIPDIRKANPLAYIKTQDGNYTWFDDIIGNAFIQVEPLEGLKFKSTVSADLTYDGNEIFTPVYYLNADDINTQTSFTRTRHKIVNWNIENTVSYIHSFDKNHFTFLLGQGVYIDNISSGTDVTYYNLPVTNFDDASMNYSVSADNIKAKGYEGIEHKVSSLFGRITYDYNGKYLFNGVIRRDGSSRFGSNNKYGYFPSASAGWIITRENFWKENPVLSFLKLRGSYGITGNDVLGDFRYVTTVSDGRNYTFGQDHYEIGNSPDAPANPDLKWEQTRQLDFGLDAVLFNNLSLAFDWYNKKTSGILQVVAIPGYVGATGKAYGNVGDMQNKGVEIGLSYRLKLRNASLNLKGNVSHFKNNVTFLGEGKKYLDGGASLQSSTYPITRTAVGHSIGSFFGFKTDGVFQSKKEILEYTGPDGKPIQPEAVPGDFRWTDINRDGKITDADRTFLGSPIPSWSYGFTVNFSWRNFDLLIFGQGVAGNKIFQGLRRLDIPTANWQTAVLNRWHGENTSNSYPRLSSKDPNKNFSNPSDFHLSEGGYFRIKTMQVGFSLPRSVINNIGFQKIRIYISSNNLATITKYTGYDPEIGGSSYGIDRGIYPQARSFLLGLNLEF